MKRAQPNTARILGTAIFLSFASALVIDFMHQEMYLHWYVPVTLAALSALLIGYWLLGNCRQLFGFIFSTYLVLLILSGAATAISSLVPLEIQRAHGWLENSNLYGAAVAITGTALLLHSRRPGHITVVAAASVFGVLLSGSRTAALALILAAATTYAQRSKQRFWFLILASMSIALLSVGASILAHWLPHSTSSKNLVASSSDLTHSSWNLNWAHQATVHAVNVQAPDGTYGQVFQLKGTSNPTQPHGIVLNQVLGSGQSDEHYTVSIYLQSANTRAILLGTNYTSIVCELSDVWSRCIAPTVTGNGQTTVQLQLRTIAPGEDLDLFIWGPQIERGLAATEVVQTAPSFGTELLRTGLLARFSPSGLLKVGRGLRQQAAAEAFDAYLKSPLIGVGANELRRRYAVLSQQIGEPITHSHNLIIETLASHGTIGLLSLFIPMYALCRCIGSARLRILAPLLIAQVVLNTLDISFFNAGGYYAFLLAAGALLRLDPIRESPAS